MIALGLFAYGMATRSLSGARREVRGVPIADDFDLREDRVDLTEIPCAELDVGRPRVLVHATHFRGAGDGDGFWFVIPGTDSRCDSGPNGRSGTIIVVAGHDVPQPAAMDGLYRAFEAA
jgi:hypothetical protein